MSPLPDLFKGFFLIGTGTGGWVVAVLKPWQEQVEWGGRMLLLALSIVSVLLGIWVATRKKK